MKVQEIHEKLDTWKWVGMSPDRPAQWEEVWQDLNDLRTWQETLLARENKRILQIRHRLDTATEVTLICGRNAAKLSKFLSTHMEPLAMDILKGGARINEADWNLLTDTTEITNSVGYVVLTQEQTEILDPFQSGWVVKMANQKFNLPDITDLRNTRDRAYVLDVGPQHQHNWNIVVPRAVEQQQMIRDYCREQERLKQEAEEYARLHPSPNTLSGSPATDGARVVEPVIEGSLEECLGSERSNAFSDCLSKLCLCLAQWC